MDRGQAAGVNLYLSKEFTTNIILLSLHPFAHMLLHVPERIVKCKLGIHYVSQAAIGR